LIHIFLYRHEFLFVIMERPLVIEATKMDQAMQKMSLHAHGTLSFPNAKP